MSNYIFTYKEENYITTFGTGHTRPCEKITSIPAHIMPKLLPDLTNPIYIEVEEVSWDKWKDMHVKGKVTVGNTKYLINTQDRENPVLLDIPGYTDKALPIGDPRPETASAEVPANIELEDPEKETDESIEALSECLTPNEFEEIIREEEQMDPIILDSLERTKAETLYEEELRREIEEIERDNNIWDTIDTLPTSILDVIEEWVEEVPDKNSLIQEGDIFCIENNWHWCDGCYIIDNSKLLIRYLHSDSYEIDLLCIPYDIILKRRQN